MQQRATVHLDSTNTRVAFRVRWFGVVQVRGTFGAVDGTVEVPGPDGQEAGVTLQVNSDSVRTGISLRDRHLRGLRFLDSGRHPQIRFVSSHASRHNGVWDLKGRLTLRGLERDIPVSVLDEPAAADKRRLTVEFSVPRRPHAIGSARGIRRINPLLWAIGGDVQIRVEVLVPATLLAAAEHVPAR